MREKVCIITALAASLANAQLPAVPDLGERVLTNILPLVEKPKITSELTLRADRAPQYTVRLTDTSFKLIGVLGGGYNGINLHASKIRLIVGEGVERRRLSISWEENSHRFVGVSTTSFKNKEQQALFLGSGTNDLRLEGIVASDLQWRARALIGEKISIGGGETDGRGVGNISVQNNHAWVSSDFGEKRPTEIRVVIGKIDSTRSDRVYGVQARGKNEVSRAGDPTIRFTDSDYEPDGPTFQLGRGMPGRFLGSKPGDVALDTRAFTSGRFDASLGIRLKDFAGLKQSYGILGVDRKLGGNITWNGEFGGDIHSGMQFRFRIEDAGRKYAVMVMVRF